MKILSAAQMREVDRLTAERFGISSLQLMESAGTAFVQSLPERYPRTAPQNAVVLCGKGNNGGDGLVIARKLMELGWKVSVILFSSPSALSGDAAINLKRWVEAGGTLTAVATEREWTDLFGSAIKGCRVWIDALLGTGIKGPVEGLFAKAIADLNQRRDEIHIFSVDIPSGIPSDGPIGDWPAVRAHFTTTFTAPKVGLILGKNSPYVGRLLTVDIGSPRTLVEEREGSGTRWTEPFEFAAYTKQRDPGAHKGTYGHALIVAGSKGKGGAAALAGAGALRSGTGLVTVATPENVLPVVAGYYPELMTEPLAGTEADTISMRAMEYGRFRQLLDAKNAVAIGPGLSSHPETQGFVRSVVSECPLPIILDADGLNAFAGRGDDLKKRAAKLLAVTPHPGEMARLLGVSINDVQARRLETARECAARWNAHIVLKGHQTVIASPDGTVFINSTGNPGMATGGSGDVLTGILAGLTSQFGTGEWGRLLAFGVFLHGLAGDFAARRLSEQSLIATDLVTDLSVAWRFIATRP